MSKTVTRQFPDAVINTIDANGVSLTKRQKGVEVNLFINAKNPSFVREPSNFCYDDDGDRGR